MTRCQRVGWYNRTAIGAMGEGLHGTGDFVAVVNADRRHLQPDGGRHGLNDSEVADPGRVRFVAKKSYPGYMRRDLLEEIQPFSAETVIEGHEARYVAPRSGQAVNDASTDRI